MGQSLEETRSKHPESFLSGVTQMCLITASCDARVKHCLPGKLVRDSVPRVFIGGWPWYLLPSTNQNSRVPEGKQVFSINCICVNFIICYFTKCSYCLYEFFSWSLGLSRYRILSLANRDCFPSSFPFLGSLIAFFFFSFILTYCSGHCLQIMLNRSGVSGHYPFVPYFSGIVSGVSKISEMLAFWLLFVYTYLRIQIHVKKVIQIC